MKLIQRTEKVSYDDYRNFLVAIPETDEEVQMLTDTFGSCESGRAVFNGEVHLSTDLGQYYVKMEPRRY